MRVRKVDYARRLLSFVESVAGAIPFAAEVGTYTKFADSLLEGVDALLGIEQTRPLVGVRKEFDHDLGSPIRPAYFVLVDGPESEFPADRFWVRDGHLLVGENEQRLIPFRERNFVLFSTRGAASLTDVETLPFHATIQSVIELAASPEEEDWKRAKAELVVLLRHLLKSPDLVRHQALAIHTQIVAEAKEAHSRAREIQTLASTEDDAVLDELRQATSLLDLP